MTGAFGGFCRQPDPQYRGRPQWPQPQEVQLCSQTSTHPLQEKTNTIEQVRFGDNGGGALWPGCKINRCIKIYIFSSGIYCHNSKYKKMNHGIS